MQPAPRGRRVTARIVDLILEITAGGLVAIAWIDWAVDESGTEWDVFGLVFWSTVVLVGFVTLYEVAFVAWRGQTPGKMLTGIRVVDARTGERVGVVRAAVRLLPLATTLIPLLGYFVAAIAYGWAFLDEQGRGWHDRLAGTMVVAAA
jgi:uncharacterized RDD family membrane protein YckC